MKETVTIRRPDGAKKVIELNDESYITVELGKGGKPSVLMKLSKELVSTAPKQSNPNKIKAGHAPTLASDSAVENLRRLRDANQAFLWTNSLVEGEPPTFLGRAIYTSPAMPAVASGYVPLLFGDFQNFFVIGDRGSRAVKPLRELFALSDCTAFLMIQRCDCCVTDFRAFRGIKMK